MSVYACLRVHVNLRLCVDFGLSFSCRMSCVSRKLRWQRRARLVSDESLRALPSPLQWTPWVVVWGAGGRLSASPYVAAPHRTPHDCSLLPLTWKYPSICLSIYLSIRLYPPANPFFTSLCLPPSPANSVVVCVHSGALAFLSLELACWESFLSCLL